MGGEERRGKPRVKCDFRVRILSPRSVSGLAVDISESGLQIALQRPPLVPEGKEVQVQFQLDRKQRPITVRGEVMRHADRVSMGIRFLMLPVEEMQAIAKVVAVGEPA